LIEYYPTSYNTENLTLRKESGKEVWASTVLAKSAIERSRAVEFKRLKGMVYGVVWS